MLHPMSHRFHHSKWRLRPGATAQDVLRPRRGARVLLRPARKVVVRWASTCSLRPSRTSTRAPRRGGAMPWAVAPGPRRHPRWWNRCDFGCSTPGSPWGSSFRLRRTLGAGPQGPPFNRCGLLLFRGEPGVLHPKSHRFHHSKWRLRPGATAQDVLRPRRGARVLLRPARKVVVRGGEHMQSQT